MGGPPDARWRLRSSDPEDVARLAAALDVSPLVARLLVNRGLADAAAARAFLDPRLDRLSSPFALAGMEAAVTRLVRGLRAGERIAVYADYDADGVTAAAQLLRTLRALGALVEWYIPDRRTEGYGLHAAAVRWLAAEGASLLVAVDCGVTAVEAACAAREAGCDLVVLDHHLPGPSLPEAAVVVNPHLSPGATEFCAAGLALQACRGLLQAAGRGAESGSLLALAALGTVADAVPLVGDNRIIVAAALSGADWSAPPGLAALRATAGIEPPLGVRDLSFVLAPRLNAAGRLAHAGDALRLLVSDDVAECARLAEALDRLNVERRALCEAVLADAVAEVEAGGLAAAPAIVLARETWHPGVIGIVASQLVERYYRPVVLIALDGELGRGSARTIPSVHVVEALARAASHLTAFGGHAMAAGLTLRTEEVPRFREAFLAAVAALVRPDDLHPVVEIDAEVALSELTPQLAGQLARLAPHGAGQPVPVLLTRGLRATGARVVGGGAHLRLVVSDGACTAEAIGFRLGDRAELLAFTQARVDLAYAVELDRWREGNGVQLVVEALWTPDVEPAAVATDVDGVLDRLFARAGDYLDSRHMRADDAEAFHTKVVGVTFADRQAVLAEVRPGERLRLVRDPANPADPHAIQVRRADGRQLGFLRAPLAARLAPAMDAGARYAVTATALTGGGDRALGLNVLVRREAAWAGDASVPGAASGLGPTHRLIDRLAATAYRGRPLSGLQREVLAAVAGGARLAVRMAPGQGLVATSTMAAALLASQVCAPVAVVLPRAVEADAWAAAAGPWLREVGLRSAAAHGALPPPLRTWVAEGGALDVLFASAEWLATHPSAAAATVVVVDDADPGLPGSSGSADPHARLVLGRLSDAQVAALAARGLTPGPTNAGPRTNLRVVDRRGRAAADALLAGARDRPDPVVVLTPDAATAVAAALDLRRVRPPDAGRVAYYHEGLPLALRRVLEDLFSAGAIRALVAGTLLVDPSAPPTVSRVVALGLPPTRLLASEAMGIAGRDGRQAAVELAYDPGVLDALTAATTRRHPPREALVRCYHYFRELDRRGPWALPAAGSAGLPAETLAAAVDVFLEAGVVAVEDGEGAGTRYALVASEGRVDLTRSLRYREGARERAAVETLRAWAGGGAAAILATLAAGA
ncbi:MAG: single-stranded-DNA-specific exonuclease RecJ [Armatimonadota bacterium]|nr:single-stranded-DNA-specific exonuclease RecJ [Armatimonadota bacterium]